MRIALQALAAVLGGTQSLHTNSLDETYALPTEEAVRIALRTQQIIADESGVDRVVDPLAGSYFVEYLTDEMEKRALDYIRRIDDMGGMVRAVEKGFPQREIAESAYRWQREMESGERIVVGVNDFRVEEEVAIPLLRIDESVARAQVARLQAVRAERNADRARDDAGRRREGLPRWLQRDAPIIEAVKAYVTLGEICDVFRKVWGQYREDGHF